MWGSANDSLKKACFKDGQNYRSKHNLNRYRVAKLSQINYKHIKF